MLTKLQGKKFQLGKLVLTSGVNDRIADDLYFSKYVLRCIGRHSVGDWGDMCADDRRENEYSIDNDLRLFSAYDDGKQPKIWIITEADRSSTTVLFPDEY